MCQRSGDRHTEVTHGGIIEAEMLRSQIAGTDDLPDILVFIVREIEPKSLLKAGLLGRGLEHVLAHIESDRGEAGVSG